MSDRRFALRWDAHMSAEDVGEVSVYSEIVSAKWTDDGSEMTAADFGAALGKLKGARRLNIRVNSPGGAVGEAVAMRGKLAEHPAPEKHVFVEGVCASAATLLCTIPGVQVHMLEGSLMMIHQARSWDWGTADELESTVRMLRQTDNDMAHIYAQRMKIEDAQALQMMKKTTWFGAEEAVQQGMADDVVRASAQTPIVASLTGEEASVMREMYGALPAQAEIMKLVADALARAKTSIYKANNLCYCEDGPDIIAPREAADGADKEGGASAPTRAERIENSPARSCDAPEGCGAADEQERRTHMEIKDIKLEELKSGNPALVEEIMRAGAKAEQERISDIDALTPPGYEQMAREAKEAGMSAMDYHKKIVASQRAKGAEFLQARRAETAQASTVPAGAVEDERMMDEQAEIDAYAREMAKLYEAERDGAND